MRQTEKLCRRWFASWVHPYRTYEKMILLHLPADCVLLDAGCGRSVPVLQNLLGKVKMLIGIDLEVPDGRLPKAVHYIRGDVQRYPLRDASVDVVISRAVLEHVCEPDLMFKETYRVLKPEGRFIFLVPNRYDYVSILSRFLPSSLQKALVSKLEGRQPEDVFPAYYRANSYLSIARLCKKHGLTLEKFFYLGQYPAMFMFNPLLFLLASAYEKVINRIHWLRFFRGWLLVVLRKSQRP